MSTTPGGIESALLREAALLGPDPAAALASTAPSAIALLAGTTDLHEAMLVAAGTAAAEADAAWPADGGESLGRAIELLCACGPFAVARASDALLRISTAQSLELRDLLDTDRTPARWRAVAERRRGARHALALELGAALAGASDGVVASLGRCGTASGIAAEVVDELALLLADDDEAGRRRTWELRRGRYALPVVHALAADARLRDRLSRASDDDTLDAVVAAARGSAALTRACAECRDQATRVCATLEQLGHGDGALAERARGWIVRCEAIAGLEGVAWR